MTRVSKDIPVKLGERSYTIKSGPGLISSSGNLLRTLDIADHFFVITNRRIASKWGKTLARGLRCKGLTHEFIYVVDSERAKSIDSCIAVLNKIALASKKRRIGIIAFGGGVVGDLAGLVASLYKRGIPYVQMPTTLLAQVDSAIGGKVAVDLPVAKNLIGAFYQPKIVLSDVEVLTTLPARQIRSGMAEIIKYGVIASRDLFAYIEGHLDDLCALKPATLTHVISECAGIKASVVSRDEYDNKDTRIILNFGHTIGHAIEAAAGYSNAYLHGEAITIGMLCAGDIARGMQLLSENACHRLSDLIGRAKLPTTIRKIPYAKIINAYGYDKKFRGSTPRLVLPRSIGKVVVSENVLPNLVQKAIKKRIVK